MSIPYYPGSLYTPVLGLSLFGMDEVLAENMVILDAAYGAGSSIFVNGTLVESPNLSSTTPAAPGGQELVTFQYDSNGNISAYVPIPAAGGVTSFTGDSVVYNNAASTGAVSLSLITQTKNTVLAGPTTGANATPTFRALVAGDLPSSVLINPMTTLGDIIYGGASGTPTRLAGNTTTPREFLTSAGISSAATAPTWSALVSGDIPNNAANTTGTAANLSGTPALPNGTTATTQVATDATTLIATDAFVQNAIDAAAPLLGIPWFNLIDALDYNQVVPWYNNGSPFAIDTGISRISAGVLGIGTGAQGSIAGSLSLANATHTSVNATPGTASSTAGFVSLQNTTPTVTGSATTLAISAVSTTSGVSTYTIASTTGAGSNGWKGASITVAGFSGANAGNNGTFIVTASTTTTVVVNNASGTSAGTGTMITSAVVNSPILTLAGTVNTGTAGTLNSVADVWSIQDVIGSVAPNPTSTLTFTHSGSTGVAAIELPANTSKVPSLQFGTSGLLGVGQGTATGDLGLYSNNSGIIQLFQGGVEYGFIENFNAGVLFEAFNATSTAAFVLGSDYATTQGIQICFGNSATFTGPASGSLATLGITGNGTTQATWDPGTGSNGNYYGILSNPTINQSGSASGNFVALGSYPYVEAVTGTKTNNYLLGIGTASLGTITSSSFPTLTHLFTVDQLGHIGNCNADVQGSVSSAPTGIVATNVVVAVGAATGTFTVTSTEGFTGGDTVTLSAGGWTAGSGLASTTATVASVTSLTVMVLAYVSGGPWVAGTYTAQTGTLTQTGGASVSVIFANAYAHTPVVVVTPTSNAGAFYLSAVSTTGFTITYANSGTQTFNYYVMGNPT